MSGRDINHGGLSNTQMGKLLGNSMSVNILERLLARALLAAGLTPSWEAMTHGWEDLTAARWCLEREVW